MFLRLLARPITHVLFPLCTATLTTGLAALSLAPSTARAAVIEYADIGGFRTFQDTTTGRVWADLDNYYDTSGNLRFGNYAAYIDALQAAGFTWAAGSPVYGMLNTLPLPSSYPGAIEVMLSEYGMNIERIWGIVDTSASVLGQIGNNGQATVWVTQTTLPVTILNSTASADQPNPGYGGIWAFMEDPQTAGPGPSAAVPEPGSLALLAGGLLAAAAVRRRAGGAA